MGLFDTVHVPAAHKFNCACGAELHGEFQTKCLGACMNSYALRRDGSGQTRLYMLDEPDSKYWHVYSDGEIEAYNASLETSKFYDFLSRKPGDGYFWAEGWLPENRQARSMGELPHQWVCIYVTCESCQKFVDVNMKFTDGVLVDMNVEVEPCE